MGTGLLTLPMKIGLLILLVGIGLLILPMKIELLILPVGIGLLIVQGFESWALIMGLNPIGQDSIVMNLYHGFF